MKNEVASNIPNVWKVALRNQGCYIDAIPILEKYLELYPVDFYPYLGLASVHKKLGHMKETLQFAEGARTRLTPDNWYNLACLEAVGDNVDLAVDYLRRAIDIDANARETAKGDPDFDWIRDNLRFKQLVEDS